VSSFLERLLSPRVKQEERAVSMSVPLAPDTSTSAPDLLPFARRGYDQNTIVHSCIRELATITSAPVYEVERKADDGTVERVDYDLAQHPNADQSMAEFVELLMTYLQVSGNAYVMRERGRSGAIVSLQLLRPDRVTVNLNKGIVSGYTYEIDGSSYSLPPGDVSHLKLPNPADDVYGLSPLTVCARYLNIDISVATFLASYFANAGVPAGILKLQRRINSQQEADAARHKWRSSFSGQRGWHGVAVLDSDAEYQQIAPSLKDMDTSAMSRATETRVCAVFGVPPILLGLQSGLEVSSYSNYEQARESFIAETVSPLVAKVALFLTRAFELEPGTVVRGNTTGVKAWTEDVTVASTRVVGQYAAGIITLNEARSALGFTALEGGGTRLVPMNIMEVGVEGVDVAELTAGITDAKRLQAGIPAADYMLRAPAALPRSRALSARLEKEREQLSDDFEKKLQAYFKRLRSTVAGRMGRLMERSGDVSEVKALPPVGSILPSDGGEGLKDVVRRGYHEVVKATWQTVAASGVAGAVPFDDKLPIIRQLIGPAEMAATAMWTSTEQAVARSVDLAVERGYSISQLARGAPKDKFPGINSIVQETYKNRARTIARTEVMRAQNATTIGYYASQDIGFVRAFDPDGESSDTLEDPADGRTCSQRNGEIYTVADAADVIGSHPNCRLTWTPMTDTAYIEDRAAISAVALGLSTGTDKELEIATATMTVTEFKVPVPDYMKANATRGLQYIEEGRAASQGTTAMVLEEAQGLAKGIVTDAKVLRMGPWFERHMSDLEAAANSKPESSDWPGPGAVSWLLWGGNPLNPGQSLDWAMRQASVISEGESY